MQNVPPGIPRPSVDKNPQKIKGAPKPVGKTVGQSKRAGAKTNTGKR
jgi:hypothetical protein